MVKKFLSVFILCVVIFGAGVFSALAAEDTEAVNVFAEAAEEENDELSLEAYLQDVQGKRFKNPYMEYGPSRDVTDILKKELKVESHAHYQNGDKSAEMMNFVYIMRDDRALSEMVENGDECLAYVKDALNESFLFEADLKEDDIQYKYVCENRVSKVSTDPIEVCENVGIADVLDEYHECIFDLSIDDTAMVDKLADCKKIIDDYKSQYCQMESNVETSVGCDGKRYFSVINQSKRGVMYVPLAKSGTQYRVAPDFVGLEYREAVEKLLEKYGPATFSVRRTHYKDIKHCSNLASYADYVETGHIDRYISDTYYWVDKRWIVRSQLVFDPEVVRPLKDTPVKYVSIIYINKKALD